MSSSACTTRGLSSIRIHNREPAALPVIDLSCLDHHHNSRSLVVQDIGRVCQDLGCFQVINHGIAKSVINDALESASDFFQLPTEEKNEYASEDVTKPVRYTSGSNDGANDQPRFFLKHYAHPLSQWVEFWPREPPSYRQKVGKYATEVRRVAMQLMDAIFESLGLGPAYLRDELEAGMQVLAMNCYQQQQSEQTESVLGLAPHSDFGCITILAQSCQGLQIVDRSSGDGWMSIPVAPGALHVHIGDFLEVLSNGRYKSLIHRAVLDKQKRASIASIHSLSMDEVVATPDKLVDEGHPKGYRDSSFRDFLEYISATDVITKQTSFIDSLRIARCR